MSFSAKTINGFLIFLMFSTIFVFWTIGLIWFLALYSVWVLVNPKNNVFQHELWAKSENHILPIILVLISGFLFLNMGVRDGFDIDRIGLSLGILFSVPIYYNVIVNGISKKWMIFALYAVCIVGGAAGIYKKYYLGIYRPGTLYSVMVFGVIGSLLVVIFSVRIILEFKRLSWIHRILTIISLLFAISILFVSLSRSAYLFLLLFILFVFFYVGAWHSKRFVVSFLAVFLVVSGSLYIYNDTPTVKRFIRGFDTAQAYIEGNSSIKSGSTVRFEMWMAGYSVFKLNPVFGVGNVQIVEEISHISKERNYYKKITGEGHLHSDYFDSLARYGLVGFLLYLSIYLVALYNIYKTQILSLGTKLSCFAYVLGFMVFGLTTTNYSYILSQILVFIGIPMIVAWIKNMEGERNGLKGE